MTTRNEIYINSLISYVNDVKPFHSKVTSIIEEHVFSDRINVKLFEHEKFTIKLDSTWGNEDTDVMYSDGQRTRYVLPPILTPRYSTDINNFHYTTDKKLDYLLNHFGLDNAFQVNSSQGIESILIDDVNGVEGYDYFLSKGMYSFETIGTNYRLTNLPDVIDGSIHYLSSNTWMNVLDVNVTTGSESVWDIQITQKFIEEIYFNTTSIVIPLDSHEVQDVFYEIYEDNELIIPHSIVHIPGVSIQFDFTKIGERVALLSAALESSVFTFTNSTTWIINHNLNTTKIIPQCYLLISGQYVAVLPLKVTMLSNTQIEVLFSSVRSGKVILREVPNQVVFSNVTDVSIPFGSKHINYWVFIERNGILTSTLVNGSVQNNHLNLHLGQSLTGFVNFITDTKSEVVFSVTDNLTGTLLGLGSTLTSFHSPELSFTPDFGGLLNLGDRTQLRPSDDLSIHSNSISEVWSIIKINPIAYEEPIYSPISAHPYITKLIPFAPSFIEAPAETWTFTYSSIYEGFLVSGSVSGSDFLPLKIGPWYDNGIIRIKIVLDPNQFIGESRAIFNEFYRDEATYIGAYTDFARSMGAILDGDVFTLIVKEDKANYLVYGSESKTFEYATVGKYFWNGKIGFMPNLPYYSITPTQSMEPSDVSGLMLNDAYDMYEYGGYFEADIMSTVAGQNTININPTWFLAEHYPLQWNIKMGSPLFDGTFVSTYPNANISINFQKPPRFDAVEERFNLVYHVQQKPSNITWPEAFYVNSSLAGPLPAALLGYTYSNFETSTLSLTYGNAGALNCTIMGNSTPIPDGTSLTISIKTNFIKPFHSKDVIIIKKLPYTKLSMKTFNNDILELKIGKLYPELGLGNGYGDKHTIQTFIKPNISSVQYLDAYDFNAYDKLQGFEELKVYNETLGLSTEPVLPSRLGSYDLLLNNSPLQNVGTIKYVYDTDSNQYISVIDFYQEFVTSYLPINTSFSLIAHQTDEYNNLTSVMVSEHFKVQDLERFSETISVKITEEPLDVSVDETIINISTSVQDGLVSIVDRMKSDIGYDTFPAFYDVVGYDLEYFEAIIFEKISGNFTVVNPWTKTYEEYVTEFSIEVPSSVNNIILSYETIDITLDARLTNVLVPGIDYVIDEFNHNYINIPGHKTFQIIINETSFGPVPLTVTAY